MNAGLLTIRLKEFLGTASSHEIIWVDDLTGFLTIDAKVGDLHWRIRIDLDSNAKGSLQISDRDGNCREQELVIIPGFFDSERSFVRPRKENDSSILETISFDLEGPEICIEGFQPLSGERSVMINLYDDQPIPNKNGEEFQGKAR